ncbi:hypothetical protein ACYSNM_03600 [Myroides sp. LJL116]
MSDFKNYRIINDNENKEICTLSLEALKILDAESNVSSLEVLKRMKKIVEEQRKENTFDIEDLAYKFGSLFGDLIKKEYGWTWYEVEYESDSFYSIVSPKEKVCCLCHSYFYSILTNEHSNNFVLLFNMIKKDYPKEWHFEVLT